MSIRERFLNLPPIPKDMEEKIKALPEIFKRHGILIAYLFGSIMKRPQEANDIDIAIFPPKEFSYTLLYSELSMHLNTDRIDLIDISQAPPYLTAEIITDGACIYEAKGIERELFELSKIGQWREYTLRWLRYAKEEERMSLRREFLLSALSELRSVAEELRKYERVGPEEMERSLSLRWTIEHGLLSGLTIIFNVADHILTRAFKANAETYESLLYKLFEFGVISKDLYNDLRGSGGFRNILVHEYLRVDLKLVSEMLKKAPRVFESFSQEISRWLEERYH